MANILVLSNDSIVLSGIVRILGDAHHLITHTVPVDGEKEVIRKIQNFACDTLIVDSSLIHSGQLNIMKLLDCKTSLRILLLSINSNDIQIFEKQEKRFEHPGDLHSFIASSKAAIEAQSLLSPLTSS